MIKRPIPVTIIACVLIAMGAIGIVYHFPEYKSTPPVEYVGVLVARVLAVVSGVFLLRGKSWARWLTIAWIGFHVVLSYFHSMQQVAFHAVVMAVLGVALFYPAANRYFGGQVHYLQP